MASRWQSFFLWRDETLAAVRDALRSAAEGEPSVLSITGHPGAGKSALLEHAIVDAGDFVVLFAEGGQPTRDRPYQLLNELLGAPLLIANLATPPFQAAQAVRERLDALAGGQPVLLAIDDAQWADDDTVSTLRWVLARAAGDRMLVALASRSGAEDGELIRLRESGSRLFAVELGGLDADQVARLVRAAHPDAPAGLAARLWEYTGGHPLSVRQLLAEYDVDALATATRMPIPRALAHATARRLAALAPEGRALADGAAVLGPGWVDVDVLAAVADVGTRAPIDELKAEGLLTPRSLDPNSAVRVQHEVLRDAVYAALPTARRRALHRRAADFSVSQGEQLRHRVAAADGFDARLSAELVAFAATAHRERSWRIAAQNLQWASNLEPDGRRRENLHIEALIARTDARDPDIEPELVELAAKAGDRARARVALAYFEHTRFAWKTVGHLLETVSEADLADTDSMTRFRFHGLEAAAAQYAGAAGSVVLDMLARAWQEPDQDTTMTRFFRSTGAQAMIPDRAVGEPWLGRDVRARGPLRPRDLAQRGLGLLSDLRVDEALADLEEYRRQVEAGHPEESGGTHFGILGLARWVAGDRRGAGEAVRMAVDQLDGALHPGVLSVRPLAALADGDPELARRHADESWRSLLRVPWRLGVYAHLFVEGVRLEISGSDEECKALFTGVRRELGDAADLARGAPVLALALLGMAALRADEPELAGRLADQLVIPIGYSPPAERARDWLNARRAAYRGESAAAIRGYRAALGPGSSAMPYYAARMREDLAGALDAGRPAEATELRASAVLSYRSLGLHPERATGAGDVVAADPFGALSERERDVADLVVRGLSYEQIARRLYITKSTVSFHLSKVYAKTNTRRRHDLVGLVQSAVA